MKKITALTLLIISTGAFSSNIPKVIYGDDNRKDVFESKDSVLVEHSKSTAAMIEKSKLKVVGNGEVKIVGSSLQARGVCAKERFSKQVSAASCSGFLVAPNILVTAGHCIKDEKDCSSYNWAFDFKVDFAEQSSVKVPASSVYSCKKVISRSLDNFSKDDFAVIELDRSVADRKPLAFRREGKIRKGSGVAVIGHPTGIPTKITDGAKVRSHNTKFFVTNLDTYGGNSGSAVFSLKTGIVEGILVRGENDYVTDTQLGCKISNVCTNEGCRGEEVTYITNIEAIKNL
jgi:V8-like Glu-specific endopeptidase